MHRPTSRQKGVLLVLGLILIYLSAVTSGCSKPPSMEQSQTEEAELQ